MQERYTFCYKHPPPWYTLSRQCLLQITKPRTLFQILAAQQIHQDTYPDSKWRRLSFHSPHIDQQTCNHHDLGLRWDRKQLFSFRPPLQQAWQWFSQPSIYLRRVSKWDMPLINSQHTRAIVLKSSSSLELARRDLGLQPSMLPLCACRMICNTLFWTCQIKRRRRHDGELNQSCRSPEKSELKLQRQIDKRPY